MPRNRDSGQVDLNEIFQRVQQQMLACLAVGEVFEHPTSSGAASERGWIELFARYLPQRYSAAPAFVVDADGRRSRQIDIAIYDNLYSPLIFPHESGLHIAAESVYAVFEVKQTLTRQWVGDAGRKAASVRALRRTSVPVISAGGRRPAIKPPHILAGILTVASVWPDNFSRRLAGALRDLPPSERLDIGCALRQGAFELTGAQVAFSKPGESLIFFILRLLERLRTLGTAPAADLMQYGRFLSSFTEPAA